MHNAGEEVNDSREATGLQARLEVDDIAVETGPSTTRVSVRCTVSNVGRNRWLPSSAGRGAVLLGLRLRSGQHPSADHGRVALTGDTHTDPGDSVTLEFETEIVTPSVAGGRVFLELDMVSEGISWFAEVHGHPIEIEVPPFGA
jgi:hypothetical protein